MHTRFDAQAIKETLIAYFSVSLTETPASFKSARVRAGLQAQCCAMTDSDRNCNNPLLTIL